MYDVNTGQWSFITELLRERVACCLVHFDGMLYAFGGHDGRRRNYLKDVELLDWGTDTCKDGPEMAIGRSDFAVEVCAYALPVKCG